jgi:hypothetical protein
MRGTSSWPVPPFDHEGEARRRNLPNRLVSLDVIAFRPTSNLIRCLALGLGIAAPAPALSQDASDSVLPPNPTARPDLVSTPPADTPPAEAPSDESSVVLPPNPTARPADTVEPAPAPTVTDSACFEALRTAGATFDIRGRHEGAGQCGIDDAVALSAIDGVSLQPAALLTCEAALTYANLWTEIKAPLAESIFQSEPQTVFVAASYACRGRNNIAGARISEHAFGRAIDVRGIAFEDGQVWSVQPHPEGADDPAARFQAAIRQDACGPFTTILGPGSDGHHQDHIHFDIARRSSTYCR